MLGETNMRWVLVSILAVHGLIHVMGFVKAFGFAELPQLKAPIAHPMGLLWLGAMSLMISAAATFVMSPRLFWLVGLCALLASQFVIISSWSDAKFGTLANVVLLSAVFFRFESHGPMSMRAEYNEAVREALAAPSTPRVVTEDDLRRLPTPVQRYLRLGGSVGQPQVRNVRARWTGRIRGGAQEPWMSFDAEQYDFFDGVPSRFFFMDATMKGLPVDVFHRFKGEPATFRVRLLSTFTVVDAKGPEMNRGETVTLFNDLCLLAPSMLIDRSIVWEEIDARTVRATYTRGKETISADLVFNDQGELADFRSDDRFKASADGTSFTRTRWTTPVKNYRSFGTRRVSTAGAARWEEGSGLDMTASTFTYVELTLVDVAFDVGVLGDEVAGARVPVSCAPPSSPPSRSSPASSSLAAAMRARPAATRTPH